MNTKRSYVALLLPALVVLVAAGGLHHGWSSYDQEAPHELTGAILESSYENPHGMIELEVEEDSVWTVVLAPPLRMQRRGLSAVELEKAAVRETSDVRVLAYPRKDGTREMRAGWISVSGDTTRLRQ